MQLQRGQQQVQWRCRRFGRSTLLCRGRLQKLITTCYGIVSITDYHHRSRNRNVNTVVVVRARTPCLERVRNFFYTSFLIYLFVFFSVRKKKIFVIIRRSRVFFLFLSVLPFTRVANEIKNYLRNYSCTFFFLVVVLCTQHVRTRGITRCVVAGKVEICFYAISNFARAFTTFVRPHAEYSLYSIRALPPAGEM